MSELPEDHPNLPLVPLDEGALGRLRELDPDGRHGVVQRVLTAYDTSLARMLVQLQDPAVQADAEAVRGIAHTLKSSSASVGALRLAQACTEVERRLRDSPGEVPRDAVGADAQRLVVEVQQALRAVGAMLRP